MDKEKRKQIGSLAVLYTDNVIGSMRTTGALLLGNSVLVYFKVFNTNASYVDVLIYGVSLVILGSLPVGAIVNLFKKG